MRTSGNEKTLQLRSGFSQLDEEDQEHIFGILQGLLFAALKTDYKMLPTNTTNRSKEEKQG